MKIGLLFKTEVGLINTDYTAGAERMFLQDVEIFEEKKIDYKAFCAGRFIRRKGFKGNVVRLYYPRFFRKLIIEINRQIPSGILSRLSLWFLALLDLFYCYLFVLKAGDCDVWYAYQVPVLAIINPRRTTVVFQNFCHLPFFRILKSRFLKAKFYFCSECLKNMYFKAHQDLENSEHRVIYNAVDLRRFYPEEKKRKKKGLNFLYASSWVKLKGIFLFLKSIRLLEKRGLLANNFFIAGSHDLWYSDLKGEYRSRKKGVRSLAKKLKTVEFLGKVKHFEWRRIYQEIDCLIFPSIWEEPFGIAIIEALACGVPVIAFETGGIPEILQNDVNGFLVKEKSPAALAAKIEELSSRPQVLKKMKEDCLKTAKKFSKEVRAKKLIEFFESKP